MKQSDKVITKLGEGTFGVVYLVERDEIQMARKDLKIVEKNVKSNITK